MKKFETKRTKEKFTWLKKLNLNIVQGHFMCLEEKNFVWKKGRKSNKRV